MRYRKTHMKNNLDYILTHIEFIPIGYKSCIHNHNIDFLNRNIEYLKQLINDYFKIRDGKNKY